MPKQVFKAGDEILVCHDLSDLATIREHTVIKVDKETLSTKYGSFYLYSCWPIAFKAELEEIVGKRQELKKQLDDSMSLVYKLRNKISARG